MLSPGSVRTRDEASSPKPEGRYRRDCSFRRDERMSKIENDSHARARARRTPNETCTQRDRRRRTVPGTRSVAHDTLD